MLNQHELQQFITQGFVVIENAFSSAIAAEVVDILWKDIPFDRANSKTWNQPVVRLGMYSQQPFIKSLNNSKLHAAYDQLVGEKRWLPPQSVGTFPIRFPADDAPTDTGKHVDASFPGDAPADYMQWRVNVKSKGRALLMLVLYSDVSENDAPTVLYRQSHLDVARLLWSEGDRGLSFIELADKLSEVPDREKVFATGRAGTVYLCHPFIVHAAQSHRGTTPKFMAQPPLLLKEELTITGGLLPHPPVEEAIRLAVNTTR